MSTCNSLSDLFTVNSHTTQSPGLPCILPILLENLTAEPLTLDLEQATTATNTYSSEGELSAEIPKQKISLRSLSRLVLGMLRAKCNMKTKQLVNEVIRERSTQEPQPCLKEEQYIRRRIYDVLNVLLATGKVQKLENVVSYQDSRDAHRGYEALLLQKRQRMHELSEQVSLMNLLCEKNKHGSHCSDKLFSTGSVLTVPRQTEFSIEESGSSVVLSCRGKFRVFSYLEILRELPLASDMFMGN